MEEERVHDLLDRTLRTMGIRAAVRDAQIRAAFAAVVGPAMERFCQAERIERDVLVVATGNSALSHHLQLDSVRIIASLNERLGATVIKRIRFVPLEASQS